MQKLQDANLNANAQPELVATHKQSCLCCTFLCPLVCFVRLASLSAPRIVPRALQVSLCIGILNTTGLRQTVRWEF